MQVVHIRNGIEYTLSNENLSVDDKVFPISHGRVNGQAYEHCYFDFRHENSGLPDEPHTIRDLNHSDYKPYQVRTDFGYSPAEAYFKIISEKPCTI